MEVGQTRTGWIKKLLAIFTNHAILPQGLGEPQSRIGTSDVTKYARMDPAGLHRALDEMEFFKSDSIVLSPDVTEEFYVHQIFGLMLEPGKNMVAWQKFREVLMKVISTGGTTERRRSGRLSTSPPPDESYVSTATSHERQQTHGALHSDASPAAPIPARPPEPTRRRGNRSLDRSFSSERPPDHSTSSLGNSLGHSLTAGHQAAHPEESGFSETGPPPAPAQPPVPAPRRGSGSQKPRTTSPTPIPPRATSPTPHSARRPGPGTPQMGASASPSPVPSSPTRGLRVQQPSGYGYGNGRRSSSSAGTGTGTPRDREAAGGSPTVSSYAQHAKTGQGKYQMAVLSYLQQNPPRNQPVETIPPPRSTPRRGSGAAQLSSATPRGGRRALSPQERAPSGRKMGHVQAKVDSHRNKPPPRRRMSAGPVPGRGATSPSTPVKRATSPSHNLTRTPPGSQRGTSQLGGWRTTGACSKTSFDDYRSTTPTATRRPSAPSSSRAPPRVSQGRSAAPPGSPPKSPLRKAPHDPAPQPHPMHDLSGVTNERGEIDQDLFGGFLENQTRENLERLLAGMQRGEDVDFSPQSLLLQAAIRTPPRSREARAAQPPTDYFAPSESDTPSYAQQQQPEEPPLRGTIQLVLPNPGEETGPPQQREREEQYWGGQGQEEARSPQSQAEEATSPLQITNAPGLSPPRASHREQNGTHSPEYPQALLTPPRQLAWKGTQRASFWDQVDSTEQGPVTGQEAKADQQPTMTVPQEAPGEVINASFSRELMAGGRGWGGPAGILAPTEPPPTEGYSQIREDLPSVSHHPAGAQAAAAAGPSASLSSENLAQNDRMYGGQRPPLGPGDGRVEWGDDRSPSQVVSAKTDDSTPSVPTTAYAYAQSEIQPQRSAPTPHQPPMHHAASVGQKGGQAQPEQPPHTWPDSPARPEATSAFCEPKALETSHLIEAKTLYQQSMAEVRAHDAEEMRLREEERILQREIDEQEILIATKFANEFKSGRIPQLGLLGDFGPALAQPPSAVELNRSWEDTTQGSCVFAGGRGGVPPNHDAREPRTAAWMTSPSKLGPSGTDTRRAFLFGSVPRRSNGYNNTRQGEAPQQESPTWDPPTQHAPPALVPPAPVNNTNVPQVQMQTLSQPTGSLPGGLVASEFRIAHAVDYPARGES